MAASTRSASTNPAAAPRRGWFGRNWKWFVPLSIVLVVVLGGGTGFFLFFHRGIDLRFSTAYADTMQAVQKSKKVTDALGEPVTAVRLLPGGDLGDGRANLDFEVQGPKGIAEVKSAANCIDGEWGLATLVVLVHDGPTIKLTSEIAATARDAKPFQPAPDGGKNPEKKPEMIDAPPTFDLDIPSDGKPDEKK